MCLDRTNNLISFIQIFCTYTKEKGLTTQSTTTTSHVVRRPRTPGSGGHLRHPLLGPCCL
jgi:hypothetical protein